MLITAIKDYKKNKLNVNKSSQIFQKKYETISAEIYDAQKKHELERTKFNEKYGRFF